MSKNNWIVKNQDKIKMNIYLVVSIAMGACAVLFATGLVKMENTRNNVICAVAICLLSLKFYISFRKKVKANSDSK